MTHPRSGIDESVIDGQVSYHQLVETNGVAWAIETESVTINGQVVSGHNLPGIIDSGSSLILGPRTLVEDIYRQIPNARYATEEEVGEAGAYFVLPCTSHIDFSVTFGGVEYPIYYRDLLKENNLNGTDLCGGQIQPYDKYVANNVERPAASFLTCQQGQMDLWVPIHEEVSSRVLQFGRPVLLSCYG